MLKQPKFAASGFLWHSTRLLSKATLLRTDRPAGTVGLMTAALLGAAMVLTAPDVAEAKSKRQWCLDAAASVVGHEIRFPESFNIMLGTSSRDRFVPTPGRDLICGFAGNDRIDRIDLGKGDIFIGGRGHDHDGQMTGGRFEGGRRDDSVRRLEGGVFTGGRDEDWVRRQVAGRYVGGRGYNKVGRLMGGVFVGGQHTDAVNGRQSGGEFRGGDGADWVLNLVGGTFAGGSGMDSVGTTSGLTLGGSFVAGMFLGGPGDDYVEAQSGGTYDGGEGTDEVVLYSGGTLISVEDCTPAAGSSCP